MTVNQIRVVRLCYELSERMSQFPVSLQGWINYQRVNNLCEGKRERVQCKAHQVHHGGGERISFGGAKGKEGENIEDKNVLDLRGKEHWKKTDMTFK